MTVQKFVTYNVLDVNGQIINNEKTRVKCTREIWKLLSSQRYCKTSVE